MGEFYVAIDSGVGEWGAIVVAHRSGASLVVEPRHIERDGGVEAIVDRFIREVWIREEARRDKDDGRRL